MTLLAKTNPNPSLACSLPISYAVSHSLYLSCLPADRRRHREPKRRPGTLASETRRSHHDSKPIRQKFLPIFLPYALCRAILSARNYDAILLGDGVLSIVGWAVKILFPKKAVISVIHGLDITYPLLFIRRFGSASSFPSSTNSSPLAMKLLLSEYATASRMANLNSYRTALIRSTLSPRVHAQRSRRSYRRYTQKSNSTPDCRTSRPSQRRYLVYSQCPPLLPEKPSTWSPETDRIETISVALSKKPKPSSA